MIITLNEVKTVFKRLIDGNISREEADQWAYRLTEAEDSGTLIYEPSSDEGIIWDAISYLHGIDMQTAPGEYLHSLEQINETFKEKWS